MPHPASGSVQVTQVQPAAWLSAPEEAPPLPFMVGTTAPGYTVSQTPNPVPPAGPLSTARDQCHDLSLTDARVDVASQGGQLAITKSTTAPTSKACDTGFDDRWLAEFHHQARSISSPKIHGRKVNFGGDGKSGGQNADVTPVENESRWRDLVVYELEAIKDQIATLTRDLKIDLADLATNLCFEKAPQGMSFSHCHSTNTFFEKETKFSVELNSIPSYRDGSPRVLPRKTRMRRGSRSAGTDSKSCDVVFEEGSIVRRPSSTPQVQARLSEDHAKDTPVRSSLSEDYAAGKLQADGPPVIRSTLLTAAIGRDMLLETLQVAEYEDEQNLLDSKDRLSVKRIKKKVRASADFHTVEIFLDSVIGIIIVANAVFIGISMDHDHTGTEAERYSSIWFTIDLIFSIIFIFEVAFKIQLNGFCGQFCGEHRYTNIFDASLILIDWLQLLLVLVFPDAKSFSDTASASLFRVARLLKLSRLLRLLRTEFFKDLVAMIHGLQSGFSTLAWAMVLLLVVVYVFALLFREYLGRMSNANVYEYFYTVQRAMLTTFRCSFGDCTTNEGAPIFEYVHAAYGWPLSILYCLFTFGITIGLFNVISAIFVECTMNAAAKLAYIKKKHRLKDCMRWAKNVATLISRIMDISPEHTLPQKLSDNIEEICSIDVPCELLDEVVRDPLVIEALNNLDIDPEDHESLSDILDPDQGGTITIFDLLNGIRSLRGEPRRSDIVCIDLMIRSMINDLTGIKEELDRVPKRHSMC